MKSLAGIRTNIYYTKDGEGVETKHHEIVLLLDKPEYTRSNTGEIIRQRSIEEQRFTVTNDGFKGLLAGLLEHIEAEEKDLK